MTIDDGGTPARGRKTPFDAVASNDSLLGQADARSQRQTGRRGVGYRRVSTNGQAENGYGLDVQGDDLTAHCKSAGIVLVAVFTDEGESGGDGLEAREELAEALRMLRDGEADVLVVPRLDRLARDVILQETLLREVWGMGREVESCVAAENDLLGDDEADPARKLIRTILGAVNEYEKALIKMRLRKGRKRKIAEGGFGGGKPRYGTAEGDEALVARVMELRDAGASYRAICEALTAEGFEPRPWRKGKAGEGRVEARWQPPTIRRIVQAEERNRSGS